MKDKLHPRKSFEYNNLLEYIFSIKNNDIHKVITVFGVKIKFRSRILTLKKELSEKNDQLKYAYFGKDIGTMIKSNFVAYCDEKTDIKTDIKLIAFYLPQFHTFKENDEWHGRGFTEWTNVTKATPIYKGHFQPQLPIDVGFYDLSTTKVMYRQIELAKHYGIYGFCFHYYWFSGKRLMENPIFNYLNDKKLDFPFCLCWANENWSKKWDGGNNEVLIEQTLKEDDWKKFANDIAPFLKDKRYIKVNNKPLIIIYRPALFEYNLFLDFIKNLRNEFINLGIGSVYLVMAITFGNDNDPAYYNLDAAVEFPPHNMPNIRLKNDNVNLDPEFNGEIYDMDDYIDNHKYLSNKEFVLYKTVFPNWDNTPRRHLEGHVLETSPLKFKKWLKSCIAWTKENRTREEQFVFINAWNEWAEGAHLEPDNKNGYAYLQAVKEALTEGIQK